MVPYLSCISPKWSVEGTSSMANRRPQKLDPLASCFVPTCKNTKLMCPNKYFLHVPNSTRVEWCAAFNKQNVPKSSIYICEDHINLEEDTLNYQDWQNNLVQRLRLKPQVPNVVTIDITKAMSDDVSASQEISLICEHLQSTEEWIRQMQDCEENELNVEGSKDPLIFTNMAEIMALTGAPITNETLQTQDKCTNTEPIPIVTTEQFTHNNYLTAHTRTFVDLKLCRVCMEDDGSISLFSWEQDVQRCEMMIKCAAVDVSEGDGLPDTICEKCATELSASYQFALRCEASDKSLRSHSEVKEEPGTENRDNDITYQYKDDMELSAEEPGKEEDKAKINNDECDDHVVDNCDTVQNKIETNSEKAENINDNESSITNYERKILEQTHEKVTTKHVRTRRSGYRKGCLQCPTCEELFTQFNAFEAHIKSHVTVQSFQCNICERCFKSKVVLERHIRVHYGEKRRRVQKTFIEKKWLRPETMCSICGRDTSSISALKTHIRSHSNEKPFVCQYCGLVYKQECSLNYHLQNSHADLHVPKKYICDFCGVIVYSKLKIKYHMSSHMPPKWYKCTLCPKKYRRLQHLFTHKKRHTSRRPYKCKYCKWAFYERASLQSHYLVHTNERKFICNVCDKRFKTRSALTYHMVSHTEEKPWTCSIFGKSFNFKFNMNAHTKRVHFKVGNKCTP